MSETVSYYNANRDFPIEFKESRLKKSIKIIKTLTPGKLLDIGCGTGTWMAYWKKNSWQVSGLDINDSALTQAKANGLDAYYCDLAKEDFPFGNKTFDLIFAGEVIEHLVDTDSFLKEIRRCLKPGGHLLLTTPNLASFENRIRLLLGKYPRWLDYSLSNCGHVRGYTPAVLKKQLQTHGLTIKKHIGNWIPFLPQSIIDDVRAPWISLTGNLYPNWAMDIILLAEKNSSGFLQPIIQS